jgi:hypothetical protein
MSKRRGRFRPTAFPKRSGAANNDRFEREDELRRPGIRIESRAHIEERPGHGYCQALAGRPSRKGSRAQFFAGNVVFVRAALFPQIEFGHEHTDDEATSCYRHVLFDRLSLRHHRLFIRAARLKSIKLATSLN